MVKFIRNDIGGIHSVEDDFRLPAVDWAFIEEAEALAEVPGLTGAVKPPVK